jgi:3'(2'), 5'-bisphosphate nucleotidase
VLGTEPAVVPAERQPGPPRVVVSRTRPPAEALSVAEHLDGQLVEMGSAGAKAMAVVLGEVDVYVHSGGQYEWDSCAPVAVALAAGLHATRIDGSPLVYNQEDVYLPDLLICRPEYAQPVLELLN